MDMFEEARHEAVEKMKLRETEKAMIDGLLLPLFTEDSEETARTFFHALIDYGCPGDAIMKALNKAAGRG